MYSKLHDCPSKFQTTCPRRSLSWRAGFGLGSFSQRIKLVTICDVQDTVCRHNRGVNRAAHVHLGNNLLRFALLHDHYIAVLVTQINLSVNKHGRTPNSAEKIVDPVNLPSLRIKRVDKATEV